jgi:ribose 5-phosphate isomerase B
MTDPNPAILMGCDHAAFEMKEKLKAYLLRNGHAVEDVGAYSIASVHYPDYGQKVAERVSQGLYARGILLCGTGLGMSMVANRFSGVRAALCHDLFGAAMSRKHNDANILVLGGRVTGETLAEEIVKVWLATPFEGGRHQQRLDMIDRIN